MLKFYKDYLIDFDESIKKDVILFFFTKYIAIKYDEIKDAIDKLIKSKDFGKNKDKFMKKYAKLNVFKNDIFEFGRDLRNSIHITEIAKYSINLDGDYEDSIAIDLTDLFLKITKSEKWPDDYVVMLNRMRSDLDIILAFCRKNV